MSFVNSLVLKPLFLNKLSLQGCLPIKWTAPEILLGNFAGLSTLSDVYVYFCTELALSFVFVFTCSATLFRNFFRWSYGIVLYEIVTLGKSNYVQQKLFILPVHVWKCCRYRFWNSLVMSMPLGPNWQTLVWWAVAEKLVVPRFYVNDEFCSACRSLILCNWEPLFQDFPCPGYHPRRVAFCVRL